MFLTDHITLDAATVRTTRDGYLVADAPVARTGIQLYRAAELGLTDRAGNEVIRVYRPEDAVFDQAAMASMAHRPMTNDHPSENVTADNWKRLAIGQSGDEVTRDGNFVRVPLTLMDADAIRDYRAGKKELSVGYTCSLDFKDGTTPDGEIYDAIQSNIRANHIALCDAARGGSELRIGDQGDPAMNTKTIIVDGLQVITTDAGEAAILKLQSQVADSQTKLVAAEGKVAELSTAAITKDAKIVTLEQQLKDAEITPAKLADAARAYGEVVGKAKALGVTVSDSMDAGAIMGAVVNAKLGDAAKGWTADQIATSFATLAAGVKVTDAPGADPFRAAVLDGGAQVQDAQATYNAAKQKRNDRLNGVAA